MRRMIIVIAALAASSSIAVAQMPGAPGKPDAKKNANPCRDEVSDALKKLRNSSWFRMETSMLTEKGPTKMVVDYVLPDRMRQKVTVQATNDVSEVILVGSQAWSKQGDSDWQAVPNDITQQLRAQMQETVVDQQDDVGNYSCRGRTEFDGKDVMSYKLEDAGTEDSTAPKNEAFRMFYVDILTGLPVSNALIVPGREDKPLFKASYSFPIDITIEPPKAVASPAAAN
jgi:hypothetical protein